MGVGPVYPTFLKVSGREVLVVGAGAVAERKIDDLAAAGAWVRVVAPEATEAVKRWALEGRVRWERRCFLSADVETAWFVVAATGDPSVQRSVALAAEAHRRFVLAIDDLPNGSAYSGAVVHRTPFVVTIFSSGEAPALSRLLREMLDEFLPADRWVEHAIRLRARWRGEGTPMGSRFGELVREFKALASQDAAPSPSSETTPAAPRSSGAQAA